MSVWDRVVGHAEAVAALREAVDSGRATHAWLFAGPPGIGKLHVARVFAAALNCPAGGDGTCDVCRRVLRGVHPDVHLVVPEGDNLLVDDVRAVREEASRSRHEGQVAVFVLDEADRMTESAANALLKVLEEPPAEVVFVLVTRSADALVGTVPSRARTLTFSSLAPAELAGALAAELGVEPEQAAWAAAAGHGRLARARSLLTDEAARTRRSATLELVERLHGGSAGGVRGTPEGVPGGPGGVRGTPEGVPGGPGGRPSDALAAAATVVELADRVAAALKIRQDEELAELQDAFGTGRGTGGMRRRLEVRHRRELRRARFDAIREAVADLLAAYRDMAVLAGTAATGEGPGAVPLIHPDRAATLARVAAGLGPAAAVRAAGALEEADRRLSIGAAPLLTLEAAFLSAQAAARGEPVPMGRLAIRR